MVLAFVPLSSALANTGLLDEDPAFAEQAIASCHTAECEARRDIRDTLRAMELRDRPSSLALLKPPPPDWRERLERPVRIGISAHPERRKLYCKIAVSLARNISRWGDDATDLAVHLLEFIARSRDHAVDCVPALLAVFPPTAGFSKVADEIRDDCQHSWHGAHCGEIRLNASGGAPR